MMKKLKPIKRKEPKDAFTHQHFNLSRERHRGDHHLGSLERINDHTNGNFVSSEDFASRGVQVIDGKTGGRKSVNAAVDLDASDIVTGAGIPMTVAQAKAVGYSFDDDAIPVESAKPVDDHHGEDEDDLQLDLRARRCRHRR